MADNGAAKGGANFGEEKRFMENGSVKHDFLFEIRGHLVGGFMGTSIFSRS